MKFTSIVLACTFTLSPLLMTASFTLSNIGCTLRMYHHYHLGYSSCITSTHLSAKQRNDSNENKDLLRMKPKITMIHGLDEFLEFLAESDDRIVVIEFYAAWCKSCHKFGMKYKQLASTYGDKVNDYGEVMEKGKVRFAQVEYGANVRLCKTFGIKKLPFIQMYKAPLGKISEFVCGPANFDEKVKRRLEENMEMSDEEIRFQRDMEMGQQLSDTMPWTGGNIHDMKDFMMNANNTSNANN